MKRKVKSKLSRSAEYNQPHRYIFILQKGSQQKWLLSCNVPIAANKGVTANSILNRTGIRRHTPFRRKLPI